MNEPLSKQKLCRRYDPADLGLQDTTEIEKLKGIIGQDRAVTALQFGLKITGEGYNVYVSGPPGIGKMTSVKSYLEQVAKQRPTPPDWCYVYNFDDAYEPKALSLPAGQGADLKSDMNHLIDYIRDDLLKQFESDSYSSEREDAMGQVQKKREEIFQELSDHAKEEGFLLRVTPMGVALIPLKDGEPMEDEQFRQLPEERQQEIRSKQQELKAEVNKANKEIRRAQRKGQENVKELDRRVVMNSLGGLIEDLSEKYKDIPEIVDHLKDVQHDILDNTESLKSQLTQDGSNPGNPQAAQIQQQIEARRREVLRRYEVNVVVDNGNRDGAPLVVELNPTYINVIGRIEKELQMGALNTDFTMVKAGSLLRAMGGFLILTVEDLLRRPYSWEALKRALKSGEVRIEEPGEQFGLMTIKTLRPQPIPLDVKVVLIGSPLPYQLLQTYDIDFPELFKVKADYDLRMASGGSNIDRFIRFVCTFCDKEDIKHMNAEGVAQLLEHATRLSGRKDRISTNFGSIADVLRESAYWAEDDKADLIGAQHVRKALEQKIYRSRLVQDRIQEMIDDGSIQIDVSGDAEGQINGLSIIELGDYRFGRPNKITATTSPGREGVIDIEREAKLGGPIHSKGVLILSGYLASRYAVAKPLALNARVVFEQSYQGVEGDSASAAELIAVLSDLAGAEVHQGIAVTGSVNQKGSIQAVGGINEKIEGHYEVCKLNGFDGTQGVIIPKANVQNLMLKDDVIHASENGDFRIWAVESVDDAIEILTDMTAGKPQKDGMFPDGSFNAAVVSRVETFARTLKDYRQEEDA